MIGQHFYYKSIKKVIATFGSLFSDVVVKTSESRDVIKVPIHYAHKSKWIESLTVNPDSREMYTDTTLPSLGFEITNFMYNSELMTNPTNIQHIRRNIDDVEFAFTSVPYTIGIELFVATNTVDEGYQILEQIVPFFTPQLTVTIKDIDIYNLNTNITFDLTAVSQDIQYESVFDDTKLIMFNFSFVANTKFHSNPRSIQRIKNVLINMTEKDHEEMFEKLTGHRDDISGDFIWSHN